MLPIHIRRHPVPVCLNQVVPVGISRTGAFLPGNGVGGVNPDVGGGEREVGVDSSGFNAALGTGGPVILLFS